MVSRAPIRSACQDARVKSAWLLLVAIGCGQPPPAGKPTGNGSAVPVDAAVAPLPLDRDLPRLARRSVELWTGVAAAFDATGEDCAAATAKLDELRRTYADVVAAIGKVAHDGRAKELKAALAPHDEPLAAAAKRISASPTLATCDENDAFARAFDFVASP
jgi:hypothetical protein